VEKKNNTLPIIALLLAFSILLTWVNYVWIKNNLSHLPPMWDQADYLFMSLYEYETLRGGNIFQFIKVVLTQAPNLAPLLPVTTIPFYILFGLSLQTAYLVNSLYLFILMVSVFFITDRMADRKAAMLSVFAVATFPAVIAFSRDYLFEFPLAALTALSYLFFLKSESFSDKKYSILFGISAGMSVLAKTMGIVFFVMPFMYAAYLFIKNRDSGTVKKNIAYAFISATAVASIYYVPNFKHIFGYLFYFGLGKGSANYNFGIPDMLSVPYWTIYFKHITQRGISLGYFYLFLAGAVAFLLFSRGKIFSKDYFMIWLWFICGYILLSLPQNKGGERYALPVLAPIAVIMAVHLGRISLRPLKFLLIVPVVAAGVTNYVYQTKTENCSYKPFSFKTVPVLVPVHIACISQDECKLTPDRDWNLMQIIRYMDELNGEGPKVVTALIGMDHYFLNGNSMRVYATIGRLNNLVRADFRFETIAYRPPEDQEMGRLLLESDFIVTKTGFQGPDFSNRNNETLRKLIGNRTPLRDFLMSDGSVVSLYQGRDRRGVIPHPM
jgi:4-amino-4-deoxy-L-arabinose transferase-like glycosyltransferase